MSLQTHSSTAITDPKLPFITRLLYGFGQISNSVKTFAFGQFLLFFYNSVAGLSGTQTSIAIAVCLAWDAFIDPFIGHLSDKANLPLGRRHGLMTVGSLWMGLTFFLIFSPPPGLETWQLMLWLIFANVLFRTGNSMFMVPYQALGAELVQDYQKRTSLTGLRSLVAMVGTALTFVSLRFFFPNESAGTDPKLIAENYLPMGITFGVTMAVVGLITVFATLKQYNSLPERTISSTLSNQQTNFRFWQSLKLSVKNRSFLALTISTSLFFLASAMTAELALYFLTFYLGTIETQNLQLFLLTFFAGGILGVLVWLRFSKRVEKQTLYSRATLVTAALMGSIYLLFGDGRLFGTGNIRPLLLIYFFVGVFASTFWFLPASMLADVTDEDRLQTGNNREGAYFGANSFFEQLASALALIFSGVLLDYFAHFEPGQAAQTAETIDRIGISFSIVPALLYLIAALWVLRYKLTHQRVNVIQTELAQRYKGNNETVKTI